MLLRRHGALLLFFVVVCLCCFGIVMLYSASAFSRQAEQAGDTFRFLRSQSVWLGVGFVVCCICAVVDYKVWWRFIPWVGLCCLALLVLCYVPGVQHRVNHEARWIAIGPVIGQPSEGAKVVLLLFLAGWYGWIGERRKEPLFGLVVPGAATALVVGLVLFERDIGTACLLAAMSGTVMFVACVPKRQLLIGAMITFGCIYCVVKMYPDKWKRLVDWWDPKSEAAEGALWQQRQAIIALGSGGLYGVGIGDSRQKMLFLPEAHTDCIFAVIGEELGLRATLGVVSGFVVIVAMGGFIACRARDTNGLLIASGGVLVLGLQAIVNIGVVTALLPNKGIALPFISSGGSGLVGALALVGLMVSVALRSEDGPEGVASVERGGGRLRPPGRSWLGRSPSDAIPAWVETGCTGGND